MGQLESKSSSDLDIIFPKKESQKKTLCNLALLAETAVGIFKARGRDAVEEADIFSEFDQELKRACVAITNAEDRIDALEVAYFCSSYVLALARTSKNYKNLPDHINLLDEALFFSTDADLTPFSDFGDLEQLVVYWCKTFKALYIVNPKEEDCERTERRFCAWKRLVSASFEKAASAACVADDRVSNQTSLMQKNSQLADVCKNYGTEYFVRNSKLLLKIGQAIRDDTENAKRSKTSCSE